MRISSRLKKYMRLFVRPNVTRSFGLLEYYLAKRRARMANRLIPVDRRYGTVLDIGCGNYPIFLVTSNFFVKYGIDKTKCSGVKGCKFPGIIKCDIEKIKKTSFHDNFFDVVTMLAVFEHIETAKLPRVIAEIHRVLKPGGILVITIPSPWTKGVLEALCAVRLVSPIEIHEHKVILSSKRISRELIKAGFKKVDTGYFECFMNRWFVAKK